MKTIYNWLKESNHYKHIAWCIAIALGACFITGGTLLLSILTSIYAVGAAGIAVEWTQKRMGGKFDLQDLLADGIGAAIGILIFYLIKLV